MEDRFDENYSEMKAPCIYRNVPDIDATAETNKFEPEPVDQENYLFQSELEQYILYPCLNCFVGPGGFFVNIFFL